MIKIKAPCTKILECTRASKGVYLCYKNVFTLNKNLQYWSEGKNVAMYVWLVANVTNPFCTLFLTHCHTQRKIVFLYWKPLKWSHDIQNNDTQDNGTKYKKVKTMTFSIMTISMMACSITTFIIIPLSTMQSIVMLSFGYAQRHLCWVSPTSLLWWLLLCWVSLCWPNTI